MDKVIQQLKDLRSIKPRADWMKNNRDLLLNQIQIQETSPQPFVSRLWCFVKTFAPTGLLNFMARPIGVITMVCVVVLGSGGLTVSASRSSLPGNILYPVKLTSEKVQVGLTVNADKKTELQISHTEERLSEIEKILNSNEQIEDKNKKIEIATNNLKDNVNRVQQSLDKAKNVIGENDEIARTITTVKLVDQKMVEMSQKIKDSQKDFNYSQLAMKNLTDAQQAMDGVGVKVAEIILNKYQQTGSNVSTLEVKETIEKQIQNMEDKIVAIREMEKLTAVNTVVNDEINSEMVNENSAVATTEAEQSVSSELNTEEIKKILAEANELLNQGDMLAALEKVKQTTGLTFQVEQAINDKLAELQAIEQEKIVDVATEKIEPTIDSGEAVEDNSVVNEQIN